ncbi:unnamed protein product [Symbiodinium sp. CCMP2592]|nr:unnamed protein product [Symbiodinium sp. CCMP2592]
MSELRKKFWEIWHVGAGAIAFNHADGEVWLCRGKVPQHPPTGPATAPPPAALAGPAGPMPCQGTAMPAANHAAGGGDQSKPAVYSMTPQEILHIVQTKCQEGVPYILLAHIGHPTTSSGDISACHWLGTKNTWKPAVKHNVELVEKFLHHHSIYPQCMLCPNGVGFAEHVPAEKHLRALWEKCPAGKKVVDCAKDLWQEWRLPNLVLLRYNHCHGQVLICRGEPRPGKMLPFPVDTPAAGAPMMPPRGPPSVASFAPSSTMSQGGPPSVANLQNPAQPPPQQPPQSQRPVQPQQPQQAQQPQQPPPTQLVPAPSTNPDPSALPQEGLWYSLHPPCSFATNPGGDYRAYPHLGGKSAFKAAMTPRAKIIEDVLYNQPAPIDPQCSFCERHRGYAEHLGADKHWRALYPEFTGEGVCIEQVRPRAWNKWRIMGGWIRINELDGAIEISKGNNEPSSTEGIAAAPQIPSQPQGMQAQGPQAPQGPQGPQGPPGPAPHAAWANYQPTQTQQPAAPPMPQQAQPVPTPAPQPGGESPWANFSGVAHMQAQPTMATPAAPQQMQQPMQPQMQPQMPMQQQQQQQPMQQQQMPQQMPPQAQTQPQAQMPQPGHQAQPGPGENGYTNYHPGQFGQPAATPYPQGFQGNPNPAAPPWADIRDIRGLRRDPDSMSLAGNAGTRSEPGDTRESDSAMLSQELRFAYTFYCRSMQKPAQAVQAALMKHEVDPQHLHCSVCRQIAVFGSEAIPPNLFAAHLTSQAHFMNLQRRAVALGSR